MTLILAARQVTLPARALASCLWTAFTALAQALFQIVFLLAGLAAFSVTLLVVATKWARQGITSAIETAKVVDAQDARGDVG